MEKKNQEQKQEQGNPSSIDKYLKKIQKEFKVWADSGNTHRTFLVIAAEEDGTVKSEGKKGAYADGFVAGSSLMLSNAIYTLMKSNEALCKAFENAVGKIAIEQLNELVKEAKGEKS